MNQRCLNSVEQIEENGENFNSHQIVFNSSNSHKNSSTPFNNQMKGYENSIKSTVHDYET